MGNLIWLTMLSVFGIFSLVSLVWLSRKSVSFSLTLLSIPIVILWEYPDSLLLGNIFGASIYFSDVVTVVLMIAAITAPNKGIWRSTNVLWILLVCAIVASVFSGLFIYGLSQPIVESRGQLMFCAALLWGISVTWDMTNLRSLLRWAKVLSWGLILVSAYHAVTYGPGDANSLITNPFSGQDQSGRTLFSTQALVLALCMYLIYKAPHGKKDWALFAAGLGTLALSQQRTVWLACIVLISWMFLQKRSKFSQIFLGLVFLLAAIFSIPLVESVGIGLTGTNSALNPATYNARLDSWGQLLTSAVEQGPLTVTFGKPYGSGVTRYLENGGTASYNPHDWYILLFLKTGLIGLAIFVLGFAVEFFRQFHDKKLSWLTPIFAGLAVYGWTYNLESVMGLFIALSAVAVSLEDTQIASRLPSHKDSKSKIFHFK